MRALLIIVGAIVAVPVVMFVYFFVQAADDIRGCTRLAPTTKNPEQVAYQCPDGIKWVRVRNPN